MFRRILSGVRGAVRPGVLVAGGVAASAVTVAVALSGGTTPTGSCLASASCFPKPVNTGVGATGIPAGTSLSACGVSATISTAGAVIDSCTYTGSLTVNAANVTIRKSRIKGAIRTQSGNNTASFTVQDSEIGADIGSACDGYEALVGIQNYTARRNYIHTNGDGFRVSGSNVIIEDNFVLLCSLPGDHSDGIQGFFGGTSVLINHNTIDQRPAAPDVTAPVFFADSSESATVTDNLLIAASDANAALRIQDNFTPNHGPWIITGNRTIGGSINTGTQCGAASMTWTDNRRVTIDSNYNITSTGALVNC